MIADIEESLRELDAQAVEVAMKALRQLRNSGFFAAYKARAEKMIIDSALQLVHDPNSGDHIVRVSVAADEVFQFADQVEQLLSQQKSADSQG